MLFRELPLIDRVKAAADNGFKAIEIQFPYSVSADSLSNVVSANDMEVVLINAPTDEGDTLPGIASQPSLKETFKDGLVRALDYAQALNVKMVNILAGLGSTEQRETAVKRDCLIRNLIHASHFFAKDDIKIMLEAINGYDVPDYLVQNPAEALDILKICKRSNIFFQFDVYHIARMGFCPFTEFHACLPFIGHIQFADCPGRNEPGSGVIDFDKFFKTIDDSGYIGWLGAEYIPGSDTVSSLNWLKGLRDVLAIS